MKDDDKDYRDAPDRELTAYERWELPLLDQQGNEVPREEVRPVQPLTAADLEAIRTAAIEDGHAEGRQTGHAEGFAAGREAGYQEGYETGLAAGRAEGHDTAVRDTRAEVEARLARLETLMGALLAPVRQHQDEVEAALVNLTTALARAVVYRELRMDSSHVGQVVAQALASLPSSSDSVTVRVNPEDAKWVREVAERFDAATSIVEDAGILAGGCTLETRQSLVDFTVEKRFQKAVQSMLDRELASDVGGDSPALGAAMGELTDFHRDLLTEGETQGEHDDHNAG
ncbi:flagellar assembly protein FliH [Marinobacter sp. X15-166B]|uniref:flagellar assembly protein FliH n=1 Tax=Marinobacter sp. X15-166B TaxID=1897620 RepID=UPI00085BC45E|nr:flagellar assembly protein FliH [Marinobacter sp. X15-166B]OEY67065.1 flagellar assembly protein FliH [Marinobacter sp. X15-166B]